MTQDYQEFTRFKGYLSPFLIIVIFDYLKEQSGAATTTIRCMSLQLDPQ